MNWPKGLHKDHLAGAVMIVVGLGAVYFGRQLEVGTLVSMGPGFFPAALGVILTVVGAIIALGRKMPAKPSAAPEFPGEPTDLRIGTYAAARNLGNKIEWRGWSCILGGFAAFIILLNSAGAVPAVSALTIIAALGERGNSLKSAILVAILMNIVLVAVFWWALQMPLRLFWWD